MTSRDMALTSSGGQAPARRNLAASALRFLLLYLIAVVVLSALGWCVWVYVHIERYAYEDQAAAADVICVFGAAEYAGRPSPVLRARLDHALALYEHGIAPIVLTLGGSAPGDSYSEGQVGQAYLEANGVPEKAIIAETQSRNTEEQARRIVAIALANGYKPLDGRLLLLLSNDPRRSRGCRSTIRREAQMVFGVTVDGLKPGQSVGGCDACGGVSGRSLEGRAAGGVHGAGGAECV
jgi:hypothetical protein